MMKDKIFFVGILAMLIMACSLDDKLKSSDDVNIIVMESADPVNVLPGDSVDIKFVISTNNAFLERLEIVDKNFDGSDALEDLNFSMVDTTLRLSLDSNGYFSRPVSTVMMWCPFKLPKKVELAGRELYMTIRVNNTVGKSSTVTSHFKVGNCKSQTLYSTVYENYGYSVVTNKLTALNTLVKTKAYRDMDFFCVYDKATKKYSFLSPSSPEVEAIFKLQVPDWDPDSVKTTRFILPDMTVDEYKRVRDNELNALDFSKGTDAVEVQKGIIGYITRAERRVLLEISLITKPNLRSSRFTFLTEEDKVEEEKDKEIDK